MMSLVSLAIANVLLFGFTSAIPKPTSSEADNTLVKRANIQDCKYGGDYHGKFNDNIGTNKYIKSDSIRHSKGSKCWNDYFFVTQSKAKRPWKPSGSKVWCTGTSSCSIAEVQGEQFCRTVTDQLSSEAGIEIMDFSLSLGVTHSVASQNCYQGTTTTTCSWNDKGCHTVWTQQEIVRQEGYKRQRCNKGHGDYTDCMSDWVQEFATNTRLGYGCGSKCTDTNDCGRTDGRQCPKANTQQLKSVDSSEGSNSPSSSDAKPLSMKSSAGTNGKSPQSDTGTKDGQSNTSQDESGTSDINKQDSATTDGRKDSNDQPASGKEGGSTESTLDTNAQDSGSTDAQKDTNESNTDQTNTEGSSHLSTANDSQDASSNQQDNAASNDASSLDTSQSTDNAGNEGTPVENQDSLQDGSPAIDNTDTSSNGQDSTQAATDQATSGNDQSSTNNDNTMFPDPESPVDNRNGNQNTIDDSLASNTDGNNVDNNVPVDDGSGDSSITSGTNTDTNVPVDESAVATTNDQASIQDNNSGMSNMLADQGSAADTGDTGDSGSGDGTTSTGDDGSGGGL